MSCGPSIKTGHVVEFQYTLTNESGDVLDSNVGEKPLTYLHGAGNIVPGLEKQLEGLNAGDKVKAIVPPAEGYGEYQPPGAQAVPRSSFPADAQLELRMSFQVQSDGQTFPVWITKIEDEQVWIDTNHPLAGITLHFDIEVTGVRLADQVELDAAQPGGSSCCRPDGTCSVS